MSSDLFPGRRVLWMPGSVDWKAPGGGAVVCCEAMKSALAFTCDLHADPFECADSLVIYNEVFDEFGLLVHDGTASYVLVVFCPWCGSRLPESQRERWFDETEAKGLTPETLPIEYQTDAWRRPK